MEKPRVTSPNITLYPTWDGGDLPDARVKLVCTLSGFYPDKLTVIWAKDSHPLRYAAAPVERKLKSTSGPPTFTLSSEIEPDTAGWQTGSSYKCTANHYKQQYSKTVSICQLIPSAPPAVRLETPSFRTIVTAADSPITARCHVLSGPGPSVAWLLDGTAPSADQTSDAVNSTHIVSSLSMSRSEWQRVSVVTCRAVHPCLPTAEERVRISDSSASPPVVSIRRSLSDLLKGDSAVLECVIDNLSSSDLYVTFQSNGKDISSKDFVQLRDGSELRSISTRFSVPRDHWSKDKHFSCSVRQGFSQPVSSSRTDSIFVDPSVKLLLAPSEESGAQTLSCTGLGFNPHIQWFCGAQEVSSGSEASISLSSDGRVVVSSQLQVSPTDWKSGKVFSCKVSDQSLNKRIKEDISVCTGHVTAPALIHVETPSFQTVETASSEVSASCWVCTGFEATVSWWMDGKEAQSSSVRQYRNSSHIISELTLPQREWKTLRLVSCRAQHVCLQNTEKTVHVAAAPASPPVVSIRRSLSDLLKGDSAVLECVIDKMSSSDLYVTFQSNGKDISSKDFVQLRDGSELRSISTRFSVPRDHWSKDKHFSCSVRQGFSQPVSSSRTDSIFVDPSVKLLLAPSEESGAQTLSCTGLGFNPHIQWFCGAQEVSSGSEASISLSSDGRVVVSSQLQVSPTDWKSGKVFSCKVSDQSLNKRIKEDISVCTGHVTAPALIHVETPSFQTVETASSEVSASCWVCTGFEATVSWWMDGKEAQSSSVRQYRNSSHIISELTLPQREWKTLRLVSCRAQHVCLQNTEKTVHVAAAPASPPVVSIRRSLSDLLKGDSAVLECVIDNLSSSDLYVTFQSNGKDISSKDFVQLRDGSELRSISTRFSVPRDHWSKDKHFSCSVRQGFSQPVSSSRTDSIFVDPSVKLLLAPSEESGAQTLSCTGLGFNPHIQWFCGAQEVSSGSEASISLSSDGRVVVSSQLQVSPTDWKSGKVFSCKVSDQSLNKRIKEDISVCTGHVTAPALIHVETPSFQTVETASSEVSASCWVCTGFEATVSWWMDGKEAQSSSVRQYRNSSHIISELTLPQREWKTLRLVSCRAQHVCLQNTEKTVHVAAAPASPPVVSIRRSLSDLLKGDSAVLECVIDNLSSSDLYVTFQSNGKDISSKDFVQLRDGSELRSISTRFSVPRDHWSKDKHFSCSVRQGFSQPVSSSRTDSIFVDPSVKLLLAPSEESGAQTLSCTGLGFNPHIQWFCGAQEVSSGSEASISLSSDGRVVVSSQLQVSPTDWKSGKVFSCKVSDQSLNKRIKEDISVCTGHVTAPALIHVETPSFQTVETASSEVSASCWVCTGFEATVSWWMDGKEAQSSSVRQYRNSSHIISELTLPQREWKTLRLVSCRAQHVCLQNTEKTVHVAAAPASPPVVSIRRSLSDLLKGDSAVLECVIDNLSSSDLYVTFQSNGKDISSKDFVQLRDGSELRSISTRFSVPRDHWSKDKHFSCSVRQGFSQPVSSSRTDSIFVDPSVKLLLAPSEESGAKTLSCTGLGFNPHIQWFCGAQKVSSGSKASISLSSDGRVVVSSQLQVSPTDWKSGKVFSCEVSDQSLNKTFKEDISVCTVTPQNSKAVGVYVQGPPLEQLQSNGHKLNVSCLLVGHYLSSFRVTWRVNETVQSGLTKEPVQHGNGSQTMESQLILSAEDWDTYKQVSCEARHICSNHSYREYASKNIVSHPPTVRLTPPTPPELSTSGTVSLFCLVYGFYPPNIILHWEKNGARIPSSGQTDAPLWEDQDGGTYLTSSRLNISYTADGESVYSCVVRHESSEAPYRSTIKDVFAAVTPTQPSATLLRVDNDLVCLVTGFSPAHINISWFLDNATELIDYNTSEAFRGPDGKYSVQSRLRLAPMDQLPGAVHTCRVTHATATIDVHVSQKENVDGCNFLDFSLQTDLSLDSGVESWYMACTFLLCFLLSAVYCVCATLFKTK